MICRRSQLVAFKNYIQQIIGNNPDEAYRVVIKFLEDIIAEYNSSGNDIRNGSDAGGNKCHSIERLIKALTTLNDSNHGKFKSAFEAVYIKIKYQAADDDDDENVTLSQFSQMLHQLFAGRIFDELLVISPACNPKAVASQLNAYIATRKNTRNRIRDFFIGKAKSHQDSKNRRIVTASNLSSNLSTAKLSGISEFGRVVYALNQSIYDKNPSTVERGKFTTDPKPPLAHGTYILNPNSVLRNTIENIIANYRKFTHDNADTITNLIGDSSNGVTREDLYFELNLSVNSAIKAKAEQNYVVAIGRFPRNIINRLFDNKNDVRKASLDGLVSELICCKTAADYTKFFVRACEVLSTARSRNKARWDKQFRQTIRDIMNDVVMYHVASDNNFSLHFTTQQLQDIERVINAAGLREKKYHAYQVLMRKICDSTKNESALGNVSTETTESVSRAASTNNSEMQQAQIKMGAFKATLLQQLESNMLADMVISTGRFEITPNEMGLLMQSVTQLGTSLLGPAAPALQAAVSVGAEMEAKQEACASEAISLQVAAHGGFQIWWNEIAKIAVEEICQIFKQQISMMYSTRDAENFAKFCFNRIYAALRKPAEERTAILNGHNLNMREYLISAIFTENKRLGYIPFRKDHYRTLHDNSWFPTTTFQGLVDNMGFYRKINTTSTANITHQLYLAKYATPITKSGNSKAMKYGVGEISEQLIGYLGRFVVTQDSGRAKLDNQDAPALDQRVRTASSGASDREETQLQYLQRRMTAT